MIELKIEPVLDPRGRPMRKEVALASRVTVDELRRGPVLLYDNAKMSVGHYGEIFRRIRENLTRDGISGFLEICQTVRGLSLEELQGRAAELAGLEPVAAIVALGDMGVSLSTTVLTIALEAQGIPSVYLTARPGHELAVATAFYQAGRLCLCPLDLYPGSTLDEVQRQVDASMPCILESLTSSSSQIEGRATLDYSPDQALPDEDGFLRLKGWAGVDQTQPVDVGEYVEVVTDLWDELYLGDGLPIIPPTRSRYERMLSFCPYDPGGILVPSTGPAGRVITVRDIAVAAVMAGCKPEYLPIVLTAFKAIARPQYNLLQGAITSHASGNLILVSGPLAQEIGIHSGQGCLGPGFRANATIGRTVNLALTSVARIIPGVSDLSCLSSQAEFTYCFSESPAGPWPSINAERFDVATTTVLVLKAEPPHSIMDFQSRTAEGILETMIDSATSLGTNNAFLPSSLIYVLNPDHADLVARAGYDKETIREYVHQRAYHQAWQLKHRGPVGLGMEDLPDERRVFVTRTPKDIELVVAGGRGGQSAAICPWGLFSESVVEPVLLPDGAIPRTIGDFRRCE
jgi:hypothetical protein